MTPNNYDPGIRMKAETGVRNSWYPARNLNLRLCVDTFPDPQMRLQVSSVA